MTERGIRLRSDSNGSTRAAFYQGRIVSPTSTSQDGCRRRRQATNQLSTTQLTELDESSNTDGELVPLVSKNERSILYGVTNEMPFERGLSQPRPLTNNERQNSHQSEILGLDLLEDTHGPDPQRFTYGVPSGYGTNHEAKLNGDYHSHLNFTHMRRPSAGLTNCVINIWSEFLHSGLQIDPGGLPVFNDGETWTLAAFARTLFFNPVYPEFTSLQQFSWAVLIGVVMGVFTAVWKCLIEGCVEFVWRVVPEALLMHGVLTDAHGAFPIYHYMWIVPSLFGGILSYICASLPAPLPGQNDWIHNLHSRGIQEPGSLWMIFILSTAGMSSGLSLGPELPLILTAGMFGSWLGCLCRQSVLQARVLNLTAASAAIGGFFGFPMAGALFVLEIPHRWGLQYFEALTPATIASIVAVLTKSVVTGSDVMGYFQYPFLDTTLPSEILTNAILYGILGTGFGVVYVRAVKGLKNLVHTAFSHDSPHQEAFILPSHELQREETSFKDTMEKSVCSRLPPLGSAFHAGIEPVRAALEGTVAGFMVGVIGIFFPHVLFWGEAQLQSLIDKGKTPLPVFGHGDDTTADFLSLAQCLSTEDGGSAEGFTLACSLSLAFFKIVVTGLSLGTGIIGGHFWGPLFAGCCASHFIIDLLTEIMNLFGIESSLNKYPCVALLCIMGSSHVVTFRASLGIILILTLTIDAFNEGSTEGTTKVAGDYSAVLTLLTVSVVVALHAARNVMFYDKQRSRGDIMALPEVLCEPGKEGKPLVRGYDGHVHELDESVYDYDDSDFEDEMSSHEIGRNDDDSSHQCYRKIDDLTTQGDIEAQFQAKNQPLSKSNVSDFSSRSSNSFCSRDQDSGKYPLRRASMSSCDASSGRTPSPILPRSQDSRPPRTPSRTERTSKSDPYFSRLDELLSAPLDDARSTPSEIRTRGSSKEGSWSDYVNIDSSFQDSSHLRERAQSSASKKGHRRTYSGSSTSLQALVRVCSFGQVDQEQPSLLDQARLRAASFAGPEHRFDVSQSPRNRRAASHRARMPSYSQDYVCKHFSSESCVSSS